MKVFSSLFDTIINNFHEGQKIITMDDSSNYQEYPAKHLKEVAIKCCNFMCSHGVNEKILLVPNNSLVSIAIFLGASKAGIVTCFAPIKLNAEEIRSIAHSTNCRLILCSKDYRYIHELTDQNMGEYEVISYEDNDFHWTSKGEGKVNTTANLETPISILYTSGSTGLPTGVMLSHKSYVRNMQQIGEHIQINSADRYMQVLPFYYIAGQITSVLMPLSFGADLILCKSMKPSKIIDCIKGLRPTLTNMVPVLLNRIHNYIGEQESAFDASSHRIKLCLTGGADCSQELIDLYQNKYHIQILQGYGSTEGGCGVCINPKSAPRKNSVGIPLKNHKVAVMKELVTNTECERGEIGDIVIYNDVTMIGYYENQERTSKVFHENWYLTGDLGYQDNDGYLYVCGRSDDLIKRGGEKIFLSEIEHVLNRYAQIKECKVLSIADPDFGEIPAACVVLQSDIWREDFIRFTNESISKYKRPIIFIIDEMPITHSGKISVSSLKAYISEHREKAIL